MPASEAALLPLVCVLPPLPPPLVVAVISMPTSSSSSSIVFTPNVGFTNDVTSADSILVRRPAASRTTLSRRLRPNCFIFHSATTRGAFRLFRQVHHHRNRHDGHGQIQPSNQHRQRIAPSNGSSTFSVFAFLVDGMNHQTRQHQRHFKTLRSLLANGGKLDNDGQRQENHHRPHRDVRSRVAHTQTHRPNGSSNAIVSSTT
jgi:hypothetical protein